MSISRHTHNKPKEKSSNTPPNNFKLRLSIKSGELSVSTINLLPYEAMTKKAIVMPHTKTSGHPAGNNKCNDFSVAQQLIPAKIKKPQVIPRF